MIARGPTLIGEFRRAIKYYNKSLIMDRPDKEVDFVSQNDYGVPQMLNHLILILFIEKDTNLSRTLMMMLWS